MTEPEGTLTAAQFEILEVVWAAGADGATVAEIWKRIGLSRELSRTTVLNQVDRLEKRGWLNRQEGESGLRFTAAVDRATASSRLAGEFVRDFFGGSADKLVMSLLGAGGLDSADIRRLRDLLKQAEKGDRP